METLRAGPPLQTSDSSAKLEGCCLGDHRIHPHHIWMGKLRPREGRTHPRPQSHLVPKQFEDRLRRLKLREVK